ncbi:FolC bifunctional protein [Ammonifex degensii KC4]|uniref:Dihydrofolate synthase/folylpolyglutamate synthase n=1 Tax=Ammonifex degensii (strain DSM 10501 / KC4) TaxID=429009 RepID=C9RB31_AMMDK|nr:folylpolyglutamate synthase/dihydrofolate synthase family protein [Ammonifex degensii]ACX51458.1 FolC bifunctional protein [Ammonifex degensii KC4]
MREALAYIQQVAAVGIKPGLERIEALLERLGNPHRRLRFLHVGGTNGKGSVTAFLSSILRAAGYRVGTFTSPHLRSYLERFRLNGRPIREREFVWLVNELYPHLEALRQEGIRLTEFEIHTALAFLLFARARVEVAVVEVGLGGRWDATNVVLPELAVITNVAVDHTDYLGSDITSIAREKAGIIKAGVPVVTGATGEALRVVEEVAREKGAPLYVQGRDFSFREKANDLTGQVIEVEGWWGKTPPLRLNLLGRHQQSNAALAVAAARLLEERGWQIDKGAIKVGLYRTRWPGRLEIVFSQPTLILDGAHNPAGTAALREALDYYFPRGRRLLVLGMCDDKAREEMVKIIVPGASLVVVTRPPGPRSEDWRRVADWARSLCPQVYLVEEPQEALGQALRQARPEDLVVVTGSLYLVGALEPEDKAF